MNSYDTIFQFSYGNFSLSSDKKNDCYFTHMYSNGNYIQINRSICELPLHQLATLYLGQWRDEAPTIFRKVVTALTMGLLAISGVADTVARLCLALISWFFTSSIPYSSLFLKGAGHSFAWSIELLTYLQHANLVKPKLI